MDLATYAKKMDITPRTAWEHYRRGLIPGAYQAVPRGRVYIPDDIFEVKKDTEPSKDSPSRAVVYARVSSSEQRLTNLKYQADRLTEFCEANGWIVDSVIQECGSGVNDSRPKLLGILKRNDFDKLVVEHKDRLTRFGFNYLEVIASIQGFEIVVVNPSTTEDEADLVEDLVAIITSFCARLYGRRRSQRKTEKIIEELKSDAED